MSWRSCTVASSAWPPPPTIAITRSPSAKRGARPERGHLAGELQAGNVLRRAGRRRVEPAPLHHVRAVQPGRAHAHEHLARARHGVGCSSITISRSRIVTARIAGEPYPRSNSATHSMWCVWGNMSTGRTLRSAHPASTSSAALGASVVGLQET